MLLVFPSCHSVLGPKLFPHMGPSALSLRILRRYSLIRRFFVWGKMSPAHTEIGDPRWHGHLGIEPNTQGFGDPVATLEHLPAYMPCRHSSRSGEESELLLTGGSLCHKGERMSIKSKPSLIICYQRRKVNSFLAQSLYIHQLLCRAPPTVSALLIAPAHAAQFHTNTGTVLKLRRFSQVLPLNT